MRFVDLAIERYGAVTEREIDLDGAGLVVIHGPNEAGKSTCLNAITDILFGIPHASPLGGVFGYDAMLIRARLRASDGREISLRRRKGRGRNSLVDPDGRPVEESVLVPLLGPTGRERFTQLFGLNHETLREGGERLLSAEGDIGRLIVEAGGGLRSLMSRLDAVGAELDGLFATRRSGERAFYKSLDAFSRADAAVKAGLLSRDEWERCRRAHDDAGAKLIGLREERRGLAAATAALERVGRVLPLLGTLDGINDALSACSDLPEVADGFELRWSGAIRARDDALREADDVTQAHAELASKLASLVVDAELLEIGDAIRAVVELWVIVGKARVDRPNRLREIAEHEGALGALRGRLRLGPDADLAALLPSEEDVEAVQALALKGIEVRAAMADAQRRSTDLSDELARCERALAAAVAAGADRPWDVQATTFAGLPMASAQLDARSETIAATRRAILSEAAGLAGSLDALRAMTAPDLDTLQSEATALEALEGERVRQLSIHTTALAERESAIAEAERLRSGGELPTEAAIARSRCSRGEAWSQIRAAHLIGRDERPADVRAAEVARFEERVVAADHLSDRRSVEAGRVASLQEARRRIAEATATVAAAAHAMERLQALLLERRAAFEASYRELSERSGPGLGVARSFVATRKAVLDRSEKLTADEADLGRLKAELRPAFASLEAVERLTSADASAALAVRVQAAAGAISRQEEAHAEFRRLHKEGEHLRSALSHAERLHTRYDKEQREWTRSWDARVAALGLPTDAPLETATALANDWTRARGTLAGLAQTRRRLVRMDEDEAKLRADLGRVSSSLGKELPDDPAAAVAALQVLWADNEASRAQRRGLDPELATLVTRRTARLEALAQRNATIQELVAGLREQAVSEAEVAAIVPRLAERERLRSQKRETLAALLAAGDGYDVDTLRAERRGRDLDAVTGDLAVASSRAAQLDGELDAAIAEEQSAKALLASHSVAGEANRAMVERECAIADMHDVVERYVELNMARHLITAAVAEVRRERQDPLVRRAGELFATATLGTFAGIEADVDERGRPIVVGRRASGPTVRVSDMSDGTRDQLFLAFRLASVESYCVSTEPLPFIADDILVHFDDERSAATLGLLAAFSATTQTLLFTHHTSVRDAARALPKDRVRIVELSSGGA